MIRFFLYAILLILFLLSLHRCSQNDSNKSITALDSVTVDTINSEIDTVDHQGKALAKANLLPLIKVDSAEFIRLKKSASKKTDEFSDGVFYQDNLSPKYVNQNGFYTYISKSGGDVYLRFRIQYLADDWLFIRHAIFNIDGENIEYAPEEFKRDNGDGEIWEWSDNTVDEITRTMLEKIALSKSTKVKLIGSEYHDVKTITIKQKQAIKNMLKLYKGFKMYES